MVMRSNRGSMVSRRKASDAISMSRAGKVSSRRVAVKLAAIKRAAGDEAEDVIDDVSDALDVEKDDVVEVVVDDPEGLVAELEVAGEVELAGEVQEISLKVKQDDDGDDDREARRRAARMAALRKRISRRSNRITSSNDVSATARRRSMESICRNRMARSRRARANIRCAYSWDLLEDFAKAMGVEGDPDGKAQNTLDALANGRENVQDYVAFLREDGDEFKSKVADELLSEFGKADLAPEPGEQQAEPVIDVDDGSVSDDDGASMPYDVDDDAREARRAAARKAAMRAAKARRAAASKSATKRPQANAKAPAKGNVRVSRRSAVAGVATPRAKEDNTTVDKSAFLFA